FPGGAVTKQYPSGLWVYQFLALTSLTLGGWPVWSQTPAQQDLVQWSHHIKGDAKPLLLYADEVTTWTEGSRRIILLRGKVWMEQGVVQMRMREAVVWVDEESKKRTGIYRIDICGEGGIHIDDGPQSGNGNRALIDLSTRGEIKLRAYLSK